LPAIQDTGGCSTHLLLEGVCLPACLPVRPSVRPSACLPACLPACLSVCLSVCRHDMSCRGVLTQQVGDRGGAGLLILGGERATCWVEGGRDLLCWEDTPCAHGGYLTGRGVYMQRFELRARRGPCAFPWPCGFAPPSPTASICVALPALTRGVRTDISKPPPTAVVADPV
jgi:hypothetical protein